MNAQLRDTIYAAYTAASDNATQYLPATATDAERSALIESCPVCEALWLAFQQATAAPGWTVYGPGATLGAYIGNFTTAEQALTYVRTGAAGEFGEGTYMCAD